VYGKTPLALFDVVVGWSLLLGISLFESFLEMQAHRLSVDEWSAVRIGTHDRHLRMRTKYENKGRSYT